MDGADDERSMTCTPSLGSVATVRVSKDNSKVSLEFNIETLRLFAFSAFVCVMVACAVLTWLFVEIPYEDTVIYGIFGFNHSCNLLDHHPAREVGAILQIFVILPLALFHALSLVRTARAYKAGQVPRWFLRYCQATTPYNVLSTGLSYMWFVNPPMDEYGFVAHYIPYLCFQVMLALMTFQQVVFYSCLGSVPFIIDLPPRLGFAYAAVLALVTIFYTVCIISTLAESPLLDSVHNPTHNAAFRGLSYMYTVLVFLPPIIGSATARRRSRTTIITFEVAPEPSGGV